MKGFTLPFSGALVPKVAKPLELNCRCLRHREGRLLVLRMWPASMNKKQAPNEAIRSHWGYFSIQLAMLDCRPNNQSDLHQAVFVFPQTLARCFQLHSASHRPIDMDDASECMFHASNTIYCGQTREYTL